MQFARRRRERLAIRRGLRGRIVRLRTRERRLDQRETARGDVIRMRRDRTLRQRLHRVVFFDEGSAHADSNR